MPSLQQPYQQANVYRLSCQSQNYAWGKMGSSSVVAQLGLNASASVKPVDESLPYAELWMGTHPNAPSTLYDAPNIQLLDVIRSQPGLLTPAIEARFRNDLPFLFKVLSVNKALSIQAHPDLKLAEALHQQRPQVYKDPNHKPEMAIALTPFEGLCGFRGLEEIAIHFDLFPEFADVVGREIVTEFLAYVREFNVKRRASLPPTMRDENDPNDKRVLKRVFEALMRTDQIKVAAHLKQMVNRITATKASEAAILGSVPELIVRLNKQYPDDVGVFCALLLNYVILQPGQAMFLAANEPHAYLSGDCVECMATSDNVVRAGLTPKLKDVETLVNMLTYQSFSPEEILMKGSLLKTADGLQHSTVFRTPVQEFSVIQTILAANTLAKFDKLDGPSIILSVGGSGVLTADGIKHQLLPGSVYFIGANTPIEISSTSEMRLFRAFCELFE